MKWIEEAISDFEDFKEMGYCHSALPSSEHINDAIYIMRDMNERENGCDWCGYFKTATLPNKGESFCYCPMCGHEFGEEAAE